MKRIIIFCVATLFFITPLIANSPSNNITFTEKGKRGIKTNDGKTIIPSVFTEIYYNETMDKYICENTDNNTFGAYYTNGEVYIKPDLYSRIDLFLDSKGNPIPKSPIRVKKRIVGTYGLITPEGKWALEPTCYEINCHILSNKQISIIYKNKEGFYGILDQKYEQLVTPNFYNQIIRITDPTGKGDDYYSCLKYGLYCDIYSLNGKRIIRLKAAKHPSIGYDSNKKICFNFAYGNQTEIIGIDGNIISKVNNHSYNEKKNITINDKTIDCVITMLNDKYGLFHNDTIIVPTIYDNIIIDDNMPFIVTYLGDSLSIWNYEGKKIISEDEKYINALYYSKRNKYLYLRDAEGKISVHDLTGNLCFHSSFETAIPMDLVYSDKDYFIVSNGDRCGICDITGKMIIQPILDDATATTFKNYNYVLFNCKYSGKWGVFSQDGNMIVPVKYTKIGGSLLSEASNLYTVQVYNGDKIGLYSWDGELIIDADTFDKIEIKKDKTDNKYYAYAHDGDRLCKIDLDGNIISDSQQQDEIIKLIEEGDLLFKNRDYKGAISLYEKANSLHPSAALFYDIGASQYNMKKWKQAINSLDQCLSCKPTLEIRLAAEEMIENANAIIKQKKNARQQIALNIIGAAIYTIGVYSSIQTVNASNQQLKTTYSGSIDNYGTHYSHSHYTDYDDDYDDYSETINYQSTSRLCTNCGGSGKCPSCHGKGIRTDNMFGTGSDPRHDCGVCGGDGKCNLCNGSGRR